MKSIMQGTTPSVTFTINTDDFLLSDVAKVELYVRNDSVLKTYGTDDLTIDTETNTIVKDFTEEETAAFIPKKSVIIQGRCWLNNGKVIGINKVYYDVADMEGVGRDG